MITEFKLFENNSQNLENILSNAKDDPRKVLDYIGLDDYKIKTSYYDRDFRENEMFNENELHILVKSRDLENIMGVEENSIDYIRYLGATYNDYEYYVDDEELNYIDNYLDQESEKNIKNLAEIFGCDIDVEKHGEIKDLFNYLGLKGILDDIKTEISMENARAVESAARQILKNLPFDIEYNNDNKYNLELIFYYDEIIRYIMDNNLEVKNFKEFLENCDTRDIGYDIEYSGIKDEFIGNFDDVRKAINSIENYVDNPDMLFPKLIEIDNLELIKEKKELADFFSWYDGWINWTRVRYTLFEYAKNYKNNVLLWFQSYEFQKWFLEDYNKKTGIPKISNIENYKMLKKFEIINPEIDKEYEYLGDVEKYNL